MTIVSLMWLVFITDYYFELDFYKYGLKPRNAKGLIGILTSPFIHSTRDFTHIINNSIPTLVLGWMLFYHYRTVATRAFIFIYLFTGITMWLFARDSYHVGMSGVIYGLTSFLVTSGFFRKNMRVAAISLVVIFLYGSTVWGIFPNQVGVSWEGHAFGLIGGLAIGLLLRTEGPQPKKMQYEIEEELGIEPDIDYWGVESKQPPVHEPRIIINYHIVPKEIQIQKEENKEANNEEE